ncbi:hypothetical protein INS49_011926 [Diaporthe citri]|uniref:uncharacterized protein n=1 Tax=Diaporthe citri TaxID=83186 RepID=UPI001C7FEE9F|nr:uncharacterized protein INS49_011926 [Diaporthe citri]KAG6360859.1 hypothetical protein INS49_011926 [Diaporthe citri]
MTIEDEDIRDRDFWLEVSRYWYSKAMDKAPTTGRLYHHLAILARLPYRTRGSATAAGATSTGGHGQQARLDEPGYAAAHGSQQQHAAASSHGQQGRSFGATEPKPPVDDVLLGIGAQFDAYRGGCY